ncbi:hypothetical protein DL769_008934 [Monosporascus sp. CRB-8-3]|nr:hypothetical protein DL769_008934 [Monosporascus sp. CRB-8-3]
MAAEAALIIQENIEASKKTLAKLLAKQPKPLKEYDAGSVLRRAVSYLCYEQGGKPIVEAGLREIDDRVKSMEIALHFIETDYVLEIHGLVGGDRLRGIDPSLANQTSKPDEDDDEDKFFQKASMDQHSLSDTSRFSYTLKHSINKKDVENIRKLLVLGEDPSAQDGDGWCALHYAARTYSKEVIHILLSSDKIKDTAESTDKRNNTGATPLHFAASIGNIAMVKELLETGADKDAADNYKRSPLFMAAEGNHEQIVEILLERKAMATPYPSKRFKEIQTALKFRRRISQGRRY